jgi:hypothetical protein
MTLSRKTSLGLFIALMILIIGAVGMQADPLCHRLIREYKEKLVRNRVSKKTAERWAAWDKTHPNFHPRPRPKYKLVPEEVVKQMDFACQVPVKPVEIHEMMPPAIPDFTWDTPPPTAVLPPPKVPGVVEITTVNTPAPPFLPPYSPGIPPGIEPVPEPSEFVLMLTGAFFVGATVFRVRKRSSVAVADVG